MKTFKKLITGISLGFIISVPFASAQITNESSITAADLLPNSVDVLYEFNTNAMNPFEDFILQIFEDELRTEDEPEINALVKEIFINNTFSIALEVDEETTDTYTMQNIFVSMYMNENNFNKVLKLAQDEEEQIETEQYLDHTIYTLSEDQSFAQIEDLFVMASNKALIQSMIEAYENGSDSTLAKNTTYIHVAEKFLDDAFLNAYINPSMASEAINDPFFGANMGSGIVNEELIKALIGEGISLSQNSEGFNFGVYVEGDKTILEKLDLLFNKYNFIPSFYKEVSGDGIILFSENNNITGSITEMKKLFSDSSEFTDAYKEFTDWVQEETGVNFEIGILPALQGENAIAIHSADQLFPAITILVKLGEEERTTVAESLEAISSTIQKRWADNNAYSYKFTIEKTTPFYNHIFDLSKIKKDPMFEGTSQEFSSVNLQMGITTDGTLIISTHPQLKNIFRSGKSMTSNALFVELFNNSEEITSSVYFNFPSLSEYLNNTLTKTGTETEIIKAVDKALTAWTDFYGKAYAKENASWGFGSLRADIENMGELMELGELLFPSFNLEEEIIPEPIEITALVTDFCDVHTNDWFNEYVTDLDSKSIISGYEDGCFRPENDITRAEFLKMAVEAADWNGNFPWTTLSDNAIYFSDVQPDFWGASSINQAAAMGYVDGYEDKTFHPNDPITRAEAVQILYKMSDVLKNSSTNNSFEDVMDNDWFYNAVGAAYNEELVSGKAPTIFDPHTNITRAESTKIVDLFLKLTPPYKKESVEIVE